ncbi:MAG: substrate-binding domain-containing protein, partial [Nannocystaceae bacterium]
MDEQARATRTPLLMWGIVVVIVAVFFGAAVVVIASASADGGGPEMASATPGAFVDPPRADPERLFIAGSGSNLPLTRALVDAFTQASQASGRMIVFESIGSRGGVRAASEGVVDLGLISRPLKPSERKLGLKVVPYARVAVVVAANPSAPRDGFTKGGLIDIYQGVQTTWSDGSPIVVLQREPGDSSHAVFGEVLPGFAEANAQAYRTSRWRVVYHDRAMQEALFITDGALGLFDFGAVQTLHLPLRVLSIDDVTPSVQSVEDGSYPYFKDLSFVYTGKFTADSLPQKFLEFVQSPAGQALIREGG